MRAITNPEEVAQKVAKYTECFDLLDRLGADNCVDPEDFDQEDMDDDLFKNLTIVDIEELVRDTATPAGAVDQDSPILEIKESKLGSST